MDMKKIGGFIAEQRKAKGLTQRELAAVLNVTDKAVSKWERGLSLPDISLLTPLSESLEISVSELLDGERHETGTEVSRELDNAISYAEETARSSREGLRKTAGIAFSAVMLLGAAVCAICNIAAANQLTWALYPISSIIFGWSVCFPVIISRRRGCLISMAVFSLMIIPFLWTLSRLTENEAVFSAGWRIAAEVIVFLWAVYGCFRLFSHRRHFAAGLSLAGLIVLCIIIDLTVSRIFALPSADFWDMLAYIILGISAACCFLRDRVK